MMKRAGMAVIFTVLMLGASTAGAEGFYVMGAVGRSFIDKDNTEAYKTLTDAGATSVDTSSNKHDIAWMGQVGYEFNEYFALEGGYYNSGRVDYTATGTGIQNITPPCPSGATCAAMAIFGPVTVGTIHATSKVDGWNLSGVGILPVTESFFVFGKVGAAYETERENMVSSINGAGSSTDLTKRAWHAVYGAGLGYRLTESIDLVGEYERLNNVLASTFYVGLAYKF